MYRCMCVWGRGERGVQWGRDLRNMRYSHTVIEMTSVIWIIISLSN